MVMVMVMVTIAVTVIVTVTLMVTSLHTLRPGGMHTLPPDYAYGYVCGERHLL